MKGCMDKAIQMSQAIDGRLDADAHQELMAHLASCAHCRREYDALQQTVSALRTIPVRAAPPDMAEQVRRRRTQRKSTPLFGSWLNPPMRIALAASFLIAISIYAVFRPETALRERNDTVRPESVREPADGFLLDSPVPEATPPMQLPTPPETARRQPEKRPEEIRRSPAELEEAPGKRRLGAIPAPEDVPAPRSEDRIATRRERAAPTAPAPARQPDLAIENGTGFVGEAPAQPAIDGPATGILANANFAFAGDVYRELSATENDNVFFSPYSISSALAMTYAGARGETEREMAAALRWPLDQADLPPAFAERNRRLMDAARESEQILNIANGLSLTGGDVSDAYKELLRDAYNADIFSGGPREINAWISRQTEGLIPSIIDQLSPESVCIILNAIYFKGIWQHPFDPAKTRDAPFHVAPDQQVTVPLMSRQGPYRLLQTQDLTAISLPYAGEEFSMIVILPRNNATVEKLEKDLAAGTLTAWREALKEQPPREVRLYLPKFKLETDYNLVPAARRLGIRDAFLENTADFSGMGWPKGELWISQIKHKAYVEVDEKGTEAAAATAVEMRTTALPPPPPVFRADRPFLFVIQHDQTGAILFMGRLVDPTDNS